MIPNSCKRQFLNYRDILDLEISDGNQDYCIIWNVLEKNLSLDEFKDFIQSYGKYRNLTRQNLLGSSAYKRMVCVYDYCKYEDNN